MTSPRNWWNAQIIDEKNRWDNLTLFFKDVYNILSKGITFTDNFRGAELTVIFSASNTETAVKHGLAFIPSNYILVGSSAAMSIYDGATSSDKTFIYLKASATGTARILVY